MKLRGWLFGQYVFRNYIVKLTIDISRKVVHLSLVEVACNTEGSCGISIKGTKTKCIFTLV